MKLYLPILLFTVSALAMDPTQTLFEAIENNDANGLALAIGKKARLNGIKDDETPLTKAVDEGNTELVRLLLVAGSKVNKPNRYGATPLYSAVVNRDIQLINLLLEHGAEIDKPDHEGNTPLMMACCYLYAETGQIVRLLLDKGAKMNLMNEDDMTAFDLARKHKSHAALDELKKR